MFFLEAYLCVHRQFCLSPSTTRPPLNEQSKQTRVWSITVLLITTSNGNRTIKDTIRYDKLYSRAVKSWRDCQINLAHGTATKNKEKLKKTSNSEETVRAIVSEGSPGGRSWTTGRGFVKQIGFKDLLCCSVCVQLHFGVQVAVMNKWIYLLDIH